MPRGSRLRITRRRFIGYILFTWLAVTATIESALRLAGFAPSQAAKVPAHYDTFRSDPDLIWSLKPNWSGFEPNGAPVTTNSLGLRGPEISQEPPPAVRRILFLGDSVTFGHGLPQDFTLPSQLENVLNRRAGAQQLEVLNAGVPGYSTFQSELYYRLHGRLLEADLVLLGFCLNDVTERYTTVAAYGGRRIFMRNVDTGTSLNWPQRLWHTTALRQALVTARRSAARQGENYRVNKLWTDPSAAHLVQAWQLVFAEIDQLARSVHEAGATLAVVIFPYADQLQDPSATDAPQQLLSRQLDGKGIRFVDLLEPMKQTGEPAEMHFLDDNHFSRTGANFAATQIASFLQENGLLGE